MNPKISKYKDFSVHDFVLDVDFIAWSKQMPEADDRLWFRVLASYPAQAKNMQLAKEFLLSAVVQEKILTPEQQKRLWQKIEQDLELSIRTSFIHRLNWLKVAAIVFIVVGLATITYHLQSAEAEARTAYAEIKQIVLPDHSKITLNANSHIRYAKNWNSNQLREVWLDGEAYFEVAHLAQDSGSIQPRHRFIVHANGVDIEVLGTSFNVNNRHGAAKVALTSGKIKLRFKDQNIAPVLMKPGEFVSYTDNAKTIEKKTKNTEQVSSWRENQLTFNQNSLKEVLQLLKDNYGLDVKVEDEELWKKTISGSISSGNVEMVIQGLSILLDTKIEQHDHTLFLKQ